MVAKTTDTIIRPRRTDHHEDPGMYGLLGERVPIEVIQHPTIEYVAMAIRYILRGAGTVFLGSNIPLRTNRLNRREHEAPDYYLAWGVDVAAIRGETAYNLWEVGKPPEWALEVASPSTYERDLYDNPDRYAEIGIGEYWMFDPTGGELYGRALMGFELVDGVYEPVEIVRNEHGLLSGYSRQLGVRLCLVEESQREELLEIQPDLGLLFDMDFNPALLLFQEVESGLYILDMAGLRAERDFERERAEVERERAERIEVERDLERERAERVEVERDSERERTERIEVERDLERKRAERAEAELEEERARVRELEERLRRLQE